MTESSGAAPLTRGRHAPSCQECGCHTGGGTFCYQHAPYMVYPKADGTFLSDRNGRHRVWPVPAPSLQSEAEAALEAAQHRIADLEEEARVTDALLVERQKVLDAIPSCEQHGPCVPHALEWVESSKAAVVDCVAAFEKLAHITKTLQSRAEAAESKLSTAARLIAQWREKRQAAENKRSQATASGYRLMNNAEQLTYGVCIDDLARVLGEQP